MHRKLLNGAYILMDTPVTRQSPASVAPMIKGITVIDDVEKKSWLDAHKLDNDEFMLKGDDHPCTRADDFWIV